ncbi:M56 family metallopeptidase [Xanthovirga aplysinae]|uniref:M56 family metallopeptidase n=1 Tax=Xanthovirga aplysinae TaxID=2529853 RepID=UPI0012BCA547|nr:M56 family metallopeptidase [Xanthovirga aplysinae]MTI31322.1 TonB family protein [Xanthovirga aplysinae]
MMVNFLLTSTLCLLVFFIFYFLGLRKEQTFNFNRIYLLGSIFFSLILPFIHIPIYPAQLGFEKETEYLVILNQVSISDNSSLSFLYGWPNFLLFIYGVGFLYFGFKNLTPYYQLITFIRRRKGLDKGDYTIIQTDGNYPTCAFFNYVMWNNTAKITPEEAREIVEHELVHIKEKHSYDILILQLLNVIFWFNPIFRFYQNALEETHEYLADLRVIKKFPPENYINLLARQIIQQMEVRAVNHFQKSKTLKRIKMIKTKKASNLGWNHVLTISLTFSAILIVSCEVQQLQGDEPSQTNLKITKPSTITDEIFTMVEQQPQPKIGLTNFYKKISESLNYPEKALSNRIEGRVFLQFVVSEDGTVGQIKSLKGIGYGCDEEAVKVLKKVSKEVKWEPGHQKGQAVKVKMVLPIIFKL